MMLITPVAWHQTMAVIDKYVKSFHYIFCYLGLYVFSLPISVVMIERICIICLIIIIKSEV